MKKFLSLILSILIVFSMAACGKTDPTPTRTYASLSPFSSTPTHDLTQTSELPATSDLTASPTPVQTTASVPKTTVPGGCSIKTVYISGQDSTYGSYKGEGSYAKGGKVTLTATPVKDGGFLGWASDAKGTKIESYYNPYTFTASKDVTLYPVFIKGSEKVTLKDAAVKMEVLYTFDKSTYTYAELQKFEYMDITNPKILEDLVYFSSLKILEVFSENNYTLNLYPLFNLNNLKILNFHYTTLKDSDFEYLPKSLEDLVFYGCTNIKDIGHLTKLKNLRLLSISKCWISDIKPLSQMKQLENLYLDNNLITDISPLSGLTNLDTFFITNNQVTDIKPLSQMKQLKNLYLDNNLISDISPLSGLTNIKALSITNNRVTDITPLKPLYSKYEDLTIKMRFNPIKDYSYLKNALCGFGYNFTNDQMAEAVAAAKEMIDRYIKPGMSDYDKYKVLAVELCNLVTYDHTASNDYCSSAYGALVRGSAHSEGYAEAYMMLCTMAGLPCYYIRCVLGYEYHQWNIVKLDGQYYHVDTSWMDSYDGASEFYFLKSDAFFYANDYSDFVRAHDLICNDTSRDTDISIIIRE